MLLTNIKVTEITISSFPRFLESTEFALVRVAPPREFNKGITDYIEAEFPGAFGFGLIERDSFPQSVWWNKYFGSILGNVKSTLLNVHAGFYLFHRGQLIHYYNDYAVAPGGDVMEAFLRVFDDGARMNALLNWLDPLVRKVRAPQGTAGSQGSSEAKAQREDPYSILGVSPGASDDDIKKAYRKKMTQNHPDKVDGLSEEIRQLAERQTKRIQSAYEMILQCRGPLRGANG